jgi:hypothetical protein
MSLFHEELFTDGHPEGFPQGDKVYPGGYDTAYGAGRILPTTYDETKGEDYASKASGALVGERASETLGQLNGPGRGPDVAEEQRRGNRFAPNGKVPYIGSVLGMAQPTFGAGRSARSCLLLI